MARPLPRLVLVCLALALAASAARAEVVRFRYVPIDLCGQAQQVPNGPGGAWGERRAGYGFTPEPFQTRFQPTHMVTFFHPVSQRTITVPLTLPEGVPTHEYRGDRVIYNYGSYVVEARFLPDGSVETTYNSGFLRPLQVR